MTHPTPHERLAALAEILYTSAPRTNRRRDGFTAQTVYTFNARELARALVELFAPTHRVVLVGARSAVMYRSSTDPIAGGIRSRDEWLALVANILSRLPEPSDSASYPIRRAVRDVRTLAVERASYVTSVADALVTELKRLPPWQTPPTIVTAGPSPRSVDHAAERERAFQWRAEGYRAEMSEDGHEALSWLLGWREHVEPGAYPATEVYAEYRTTADANGKSRPLGRNKFHRVAEHDDVLGKRRRRVSGPVYVLGQEPVTMTKDDRAKLVDLVLAELVEKYGREFELGIAERHAAKLADRATAANVDELAARRLRRAA